MSGGDEIKNGKECVRLSFGEVEDISACTAAGSFRRVLIKVSTPLGGFSVS